MKEQGFSRVRGVESYKQAERGLLIVIRSYLQIYMQANNILGPQGLSVFGMNVRLLKMDTFCVAEVKFC